MSFYQFYQELQRRNVIKAGISYLAVSWLTLQIASIVFPAWELPPSATRVLLILLVVGFPIWLIFA